MPSYTPIQNGFNSGEFSGLMLGRTDLASYARACRLANNFQIVPQGGLLRRSGTRYVAPTKFSDRRARLQPFVFSDVQAYVIEFGHLYARFYSNEGRLIQQTLANLLPAEQVATQTDEFTYTGHGYLLDDGPVRISSTGTLPGGTDAVTDYWIKPAQTLTFAPGDIDAGPNEDITIPGHDLQTQMGPYRWATSLTLPGGMSFDTDYYIIRVDANRFQLSLTKGGGAEAFTSQGTGILQLIPTDDYQRNSFRLSVGPGGPGIPLSTPGTGLHTITPQNPQPIEIATPYTEDEVDDLQFAQSADVLYITHKDHQPRTLSRNSAAGFGVSLYEAIDGPYLDENLNASLTLESTATSGSNVTLTAKLGGSATAFFKGTDVGRTVRIYGGNFWGYAKIVAVDPNSFTDAAIAQSSLHATPATAIDPVFDVITTAAAHSFDTGELVRFKVQTGGSLGGTGIAENTDYYINNLSATTFSLHTSRADAIADANRVPIAVGTYAPTVTVTSSVMDVLSHGFIGGEGPVQITNVGGSLPEGLSEGTNYYVGYVTAGAFTLSLSRGGEPAGINDAVGGGVHTVQGDGLPLPTCTADVLEDFEDTSPHAAWRMSAWGSAEELGWPRAVTFHEQRLWFAATRGQPDTVFATRSGNFVNFGPTGDLSASTLDSTVGDSNGIIYELGANQVNVIAWMSPTNTLVLGTSSSNWTLSAALSGEAITPLNVQVRRTSAQGSAPITPVIVNERVISISKTQLKLFSLGFTFETDTFTTEDLTLLAEHITRSGVIRMDYAPEPYSTIYAVRMDGLLAALTIVRDQRIIGWTRHTLGGRFVASYGIGFIDEDVQTRGELAEGIDNTDASGTSLTITAHQFISGDKVRVRPTSGSLPGTVLAQNTVYWLNAIDANTVSFHTTLANSLSATSPIDLTPVGTGTFTVESLHKDTIEAPAHGIETGSVVRFKAGAGAILPAPFVENRDYYANAVNFDTLSFHTSETDAEKNANRIDITTVGIGNNMLGVATDAVAESVAVIPSPDGDASLVGRPNTAHDQVWTIAKRTVGGETVKHVEFIEDLFAEDDATADAFFVDAGITYNGAATASVAGVTHLAGEQVDVLADGRPHLGLDVSPGGVVTLPVAAAKVHIGYRFPSELQTLRQIPDDSEGTAQSKLGRINHLTMRLYASLGGEYGTDRSHVFNLGRLLLPPGLKTDTVASPFTGDVDLPFEGAWDTESGIYVAQREPLPLAVVALLPSLEKGVRSDRARGGTA